MHRDADGTGLIGNGPVNGLADPPGGIGAELEFAAELKLLDRPDQSLVAFLDQVKERKATTGVFFGDRDHQAQVGFDQVLTGNLAVAGQVQVALDLARDSPHPGVYRLNGFVTQLDLEARYVADAGCTLNLGTQYLLDQFGFQTGFRGQHGNRGYSVFYPAGQIDLFLEGEQRHLANLVQVLPHRVGGGNPGSEGQVILEHIVVGIVDIDLAGQDVEVGIKQVGTVFKTVFGGLGFLEGWAHHHCWIHGFLGRAYPFGFAAALGSGAGLGGSLCGCLAGGGFLGGGFANGHGLLRGLAAAGDQNLVCTTVQPVNLGKEVRQEGLVG